MANLNIVFLMGNLTRDPQVRYLPSGTCIAEIGLAVNRTWMDRESGERREDTTFVDCKAIGRSAENLAKWFSKGRPIFIEGRLEYRSWEAKDGSGKRSKLDVFIENWQFVGGRGGDDSPGGGGGMPREGRPAPQRNPDEGYGGGGGGGGGSGGGGGGGGTDFDDDVPF